MGSFSSITKYDIRILAPLVLVGCVIIMMMGRRLNVMSFGEEEAKTMGVDPRITRIVVISAATDITAASVSAMRPYRMDRTCSSASVQEPGRTEFPDTSSGKRCYRRRSFCW